MQRQQEQLQQWVHGWLLQGEQVQGAVQSGPEVHWSCSSAALKLLLLLPGLLGLMCLQEQADEWLPMMLQQALPVHSHLAALMLVPVYLEAALHCQAQEAVRAALTYWCQCG
jgi:hypothetical protein